MAATLNLEKPAAPTDKRVLGIYWLLAETEDIEKALQSIELELAVRKARAAVKDQNAALIQARTEDVRAEILAIEAHFAAEVTDE